MFLYVMFFKSYKMFNMNYSLVFSDTPVESTESTKNLTTLE